MQIPQDLIEIAALKLKSIQSEHSWNLPGYGHRFQRSQYLHPPFDRSIPDDKLQGFLMLCLY